MNNPNDGLCPIIPDTGAAQEVVTVAPDTVADVSMVPDQHAGSAQVVMRRA